MLKTMLLYVIQGLGFSILFWRLHQMWGVYKIKADELTLMRFQKIVAELELELEQFSYEF